MVVGDACLTCSTCIEGGLGDLARPRVSHFSIVAFQDCSNITVLHWLILRMLASPHYLYLF